MSTPSTVGRDIAVGLSALITAIAAFLGINAWRRRLRGATEYKIALEVLEAVFALRESIHEARSRAALPSDLPRAPPDTAKTGESEVLQAARTYRERLARVGPARERLLRAQEEALALWGDPAKESLADIHLIVQELNATSERYFVAELDRARHGDGHGRVEEPDAEMIVMKRMLYPPPDAKGRDPYGEKIARAVAAAEEFYRGRLR